MRSNWLYSSHHAITNYGLTAAALLMQRGWPYLIGFETERKSILPGLQLGAVVKHYSISSDILPILTMVQAEVLIVSSSNIFGSKLFVALGLRLTIRYLYFLCL